MPEKMENTGSYKFAVVGLGFIHPRHRAAIESIGGEIILTCDIDPTKNADHTSFDEMLECPTMADVDYISICTPNYLHADMCRKALATGKKVLCEKPLTVDTNYDGLGPVNVVLQLRYNPLVQFLGKVTGEIDITVKTYREPKYWESWKGDPTKSGGILFNMGIHYVDLLVHLLGDPKKIVSAKHTKTLAKGEVQFERGIGTYHIEFLPNPAPVTRKITINGSTVDLEGATIPLNDTGQVPSLHNLVYKELIAGKGFKLEDVVKSLNLANELRTM